MADGQSVRRQGMYWGKINDSQQAASPKTLEVVAEDRQEFWENSLLLNTPRNILTSKS